MRTDLFHITINGEPACQRGIDPVAFMDRARELLLIPICSGPEVEIAPLVTLYGEFYENVAMVQGGCPAAEQEE